METRSMSRRMQATMEVVLPSEQTNMMNAVELSQDDMLVDGPTKCKKCTNFFSTPEQENLCYQCFLQLCKENGIPIPSKYLKQDSATDNTIYESVISGIVKPKKSATNQLLIGMNDKESLLSSLPDDLIKMIHTNFLQIKFGEDMRLTPIQFKKLLSIMKQPSLTFTDYINYLTGLEVINLKIKSCNHSVHNDPHTQMLGNDIGIGLCIHHKTLSLNPIKLLTAEQGSQLYQARYETVSKNTDEYNKMWIWEHLICMNIGDYWNIGKNKFGNVSVCYYDRPAPVFIVDDEYRTEELTRLQAVTNRDKVLCEMKVRSKCGLSQIRYAFGTSMYYQKNAELSVDIHDYYGNYIKTAMIDGKYFNSILS